MFKRFTIVTLFLLTLTGAAYGQTPVTVTGTIYAPNGALATSGYVQFTITPTSQSIQYFVQGIGIIAPQTARCGISGAGLIRNLALSGACLVWGNDVITPGNTTYTVQYAPANVVSNTIRQLLIRGTTSNLNAPIFAPVIAIVPQFQTITTSPIAVNLIPAADSVFNVGNPQAYYAAGYFRNIFADTCVGCGLSTIGDLPPLFTTTLVGANVTFNLTAAPGNTVFGRCNPAAGAPSYCLLINSQLPAAISQTSFTASGFLQSPIFRSSVADPADTGLFRLGNNESICWEFNPTGTDKCLVFNNLDQFDFGATEIHGGSFQASVNMATPQLINNASPDPADNGFIRMGNTDIIAWESNPTGADITLTANALNQVEVSHTFKAPSTFTTTNCADSAGAAACGAAAAGHFVIDAGSTTTVVSTTAVTANSEIMLTFDSSLSTLLGVTCNGTIGTVWVSARTAATSFTVTISAMPAVNPACIGYRIVN